MSVNAGRSDLPPVRKTVTVERPPDQAFEIFTAGIARWWPLCTHSVSQERAASCVIEPGAGGAVYEVRDDGERFPWGRVLVWEPPRRIVLGWHPGRPSEAAQEVEVRFTAAGAGTRVDLEHRHWDRLGEDAPQARRSYEGGWEVVFSGSFAQACRR